MQADPEIELEVSTLVVEYIVATTGVNPDITDLTNPLLSIIAGEASTLHVADPSESPQVRSSSSMPAWCMVEKCS